MYTNPAPKRPVGMALGVIDKWLAMRLVQAALARFQIKNIPASIMYRRCTEKIWQNANRFCLQIKVKHYTWETQLSISKYVYFVESPKTVLQKMIVFKAVFPPKLPTSTIAQTKFTPLVELVRMKAKTEQYFDSVTEFTHFKGISISIAF